jgi:FKBP-type peptidyl-prolyl cis-trans isomerase FkpA
MNKTFCLLAVAFLILATGCQEQKFKKEQDGTEYKIISSGGKNAVAGDFMEVNILAKYKDSVLFSSIESSMPRFIPFDTAQLPPFFKVIHEGDSMVIRESTDSLKKRGQFAPFMQDGQYIYQTFKIVKIFSSKEAADSAAKPFEVLAKQKSYDKEKAQIEKEIASNDSLAKADDKEITAYIAKKNLTAKKTAWGTYVAITTPGTGDYLSKNDVAEVEYTGKTFEDSTFDSNTDKKFNHLQPLYVDMSRFTGIIPGWIDGLQLMQKGSVGQIIIPSYLAYGQGGRPPKIQPNANLVFDIKVTNVLTQEEYQQKMEEQQKMMQMMREQMQQQQQQQQQQKPAPKAK